MTPKEKAEELLSKYYLQVKTLAQQKKCALITVDEILDIIDKHNITTWDADIFKYWFEVKQEINNL